MNTDPPATNMSPLEASPRGDGHTLSDFRRWLHEAAGLIPNGPPPGQEIFKLLTSELRAHNLSAAEAVRQGIEAAREADPDFEPRYNPHLLEQ
jgi:hypothetical protein